jgi:hypothetical protein
MARGCVLKTPSGRQKKGFGRVDTGAGNEKCNNGEREKAGVKPNRYTIKCAVRDERWEGVRLLKAEASGKIVSILDKHLHAKGIGKGGKGEVHGYDHEFSVPSFIGQRRWHDTGWHGSQAPTTGTKGRFTVTRASSPSLAASYSSRIRKLGSWRVSGCLNVVL